MKTNLKTSLVIVIALVSFSFDRIELPDNSDNSFVTNMSRESLLKAVRQEPKVKEAIVTDANVLYAGVLDDGTRRDGYASYLCELVREHDRTVVRVKVVKFGSTNDPKRDNAYGILLGESWCK